MISAMLSTVHIALIAITAQTAIFGITPRVPRKPTSAA